MQCRGNHSLKTAFVVTNQQVQYKSGIFSFISRYKLQQNDLKIFLFRPGPIIACLNQVVCFVIL